MNSRLHTDRMRERARRVYAAAALRENIADLAEKVAHGDVNLNGARVAMGFPPIRQLRGLANQPTRPGCGHEPSWWTQDGGGYTCMVCGRQPHVRKRGPQRMREHTRSLLLNALRGDGTPHGAARIAICRAYRVLPDEIGITNQTEPNGANHG